MIPLLAAVIAASCATPSTTLTDAESNQNAPVGSSSPSSSEEGAGDTLAPNVVVFHSPLMASDDINFEHISVEQGLSQSSVHAILQDYQGYMWFGTLDGLNRYDGNEITIYKHDPEDPTSISDNMITEIFEDSQGALWIGTSSGGLNRFDRETQSFSTIKHDPDSQNSLSSNSILAITEDADGALWIGTNGGGLNRLEPESGTVTRYQNDPSDPYSLSNNTVVSIFEDSQGNLWIATDGRGLNLLDKETGQFSSYQKEVGNPRSLINNYVVSITEDSGGTLWVGTRGGTLHKFDPLNKLFYRYQSGSIDPDSLVDHAITSIIEDHSGRLWIAANGGGVMLFNRQSGQFRHFQNDLTDPSSLSSNSVRSMFEDNSGVLWIGTDGGGVNKFSSSSMRFQHVQHDPNDQYSLSSNDVLSIFEDRGGDLWAGTLGGGLNRFELDAGRLTRYSHEPNNPDSLVSNIVFSIIQDRHGNFWIGTSSGLDRLNSQTGIFEHFQHEPDNSNSLSHNVILSLVEDKGGTVWIGTSGGLNSYDPIKSKFTRYLNDPQDPTSISGGSVRAIYADGAGSLWLATDNGLDRFDVITGDFYHFQHDASNPSSLSDNRVLSIYPGNDRSLWIGTYGGGLNRFDVESQSFFSYREKDGLPNDAILCIQEDDEDHLWISTIQGLAKFDPEQGIFKNYDARDGLQSNEFNANSCATGENGKMYFGGINGFNAFYPSSITDNPYVPSIVLSELTQGGESIPIGQNDLGEDEVVFYWPNDFFEFEIASLSYSQSDKNQYASKLEGYDEGWNYMGTRRSGRYANLPAGDYELKLKGSNNDGIWNEEGISLNISIIPPFWQTAWFRLLVAVVIVGSIVLGYRLRVRGIEARTHELEFQVEERTRDLELRSHELERRKNAAEGLREILIIINSNQSLEESLDYIVRQVAALTGAGEVVIFNSAADGHPTIIASNVPGDQIGTELLAGPVLSALQEGQTIIFPDRGESSLIEDAILPLFSERQQLLIGLPLSLGSEPYGGLVLHFSGEQLFSEEDLELSATFADQAMLAIANAQLRDRAEQTAVATERSRLARDLHDAVTQTLFSASLIAEVLPATWEANDEEGRHLLKELRQLSRGALAEMRTLLLELRPAALADANLGDLLSQLADSLTGRTGTPVDLVIKGRCSLPTEIHIALYRIAQEALNNVVKHANASHVSVSLLCAASSRAAGEVTLVVKDNGIGFDPDCTAADCLGLSIMRERAQAAGASLSIDSQLGVGTEVVVQW